MAMCEHLWEMDGVQFGFVAFERCFHCNGLRTYFTREPAPFLGEEYREGACYWSRVENAQSFHFGLRCARCGAREAFDDLMGLLYCTGCDPQCKVEQLRQQHEAAGAWILVAFGFIDKQELMPLSPTRLAILTDYFNQRRDPTRRKVRLLSFELITDFSRCEGDFLHDVGMLSLQPPPPRRPAFESPATGAADQETPHDDPRTR
jgi:hypothetical protein